MQNRKHIVIWKDASTYKTQRSFFFIIHSYCTDNEIPFHWVNFQQLALLYLCHFPRVKWEMRRLRRKIGWAASYLEPMETKTRSATAPQYFALSQGSQESDWNFIFGVTNFWLVRFLQPVIISNVSVGLHCYLKTLTRVLYNFPIFPAPSVLNCIGRWIFGIWGCQVSAMEDFMH